MDVLIGFAIASFALVGLAIFLFRYRGSRARFAGLSAFALGLIAVFIVIHATVGPDHPVAGIVFYVSHVVMCMVELLLLGSVLGLRDPPRVAYRKAEITLGLVLAVLAVLFYGGMAWWAPQEQDKVPRLVYVAVPLLIGVAIVARFGFARDGLVGGSVFLASSSATVQGLQLASGGGWLVSWVSASRTRLCCPCLSMRNRCGPVLSGLNDVVPSLATTTRPDGDNSKY